MVLIIVSKNTATAKSLQSCLTLRPHPWDSPGKNTGVGCRFLLQCIKVKSESEVTQSCLTLCDPLDCSLPGSSVHGIFQARVLEWGAIAFSNQEIRKTLLISMMIMVTMMSLVCLTPSKASSGMVTRGW